MAANANAKKSKAGGVAKKKAKDGVRENSPDKTRAVNPKPKRPVAAPVRENSPDKTRSASVKKKPSKKSPRGI
jgi:hypothetical protein